MKLPLDAECIRRYNEYDCWVDRGAYRNMVVHGNYEWDKDKADDNAHKHGVTFEEAVEVFDDPYALEECDAAHSNMYEWRHRIIGAIKRRVIVFVAYTMRGERTRLISAREAESYERKEYYDRF